jgi:hypothetical protein
MVTFENYRVGESLVSGEIEHGEGFTRVRVTVTGPPLDVTISPAFPEGTTLTGLRGNNLLPEPSEAGVDLHMPVRVEKAEIAEVTYDVTYGPESEIQLRAPEIGDRAR